MSVKVDLETGLVISIDWGASPNLDDVWTYTPDPEDKK